MAWLISGAATTPLHVHMYRTRGCIPVLVDILLQCSRRSHHRGRDSALHMCKDFVFSARTPLSATVAGAFAAASYLDPLVHPPHARRPQWPSPPGATRVRWGQRDALNLGRRRSTSAALSGRVIMTLLRTSFGVPVFCL